LTLERKEENMRTREKRLKQETNLKTKEAKKMKKTLFTMLVAFLAVVMVYGFPAKTDAAAVTGTCVDCHSMHASQGGTSSTPNNFLAKNTCIGCHTDTANDAKGVDIDGTATAAGTLLLTTANAANKRHDVSGWSTDGAGTAVPGNAGSAITGVARGTLTCAGSLGCHGTHVSAGDAGIQGYHHESSRVGYRFLHYGVGAYDVANNIVGGSAVNRERAGATAANHNVYSASASQGISKFCANCHGTFHGTGNTNAATPFKRHPTDIALTGLGTLASVITDYNTNPFAFLDYTTLTIGEAYTAATTGAQVACVSCHRAHGSANASLLRFVYANMNAGSGSNEGGCENCHYKQR